MWQCKSDKPSISSLVSATGGHLGLVAVLVFYAVYHAQGNYYKGKHLLGVLLTVLEM